MIALLAAALAAAFAPPLETPLRYKTVEMRLVRGGEAQITLRQILRLVPVAAGYEATIIAGDHAVTGPEPYRTLFDTMLAPFAGVATRARLDRKGAVTGALDSASTWAAASTAVKAMLVRMDAEPSLPPAIKAAARATAASTIDQASPEQRDRYVADAAGALLAPALPALEIGESRAFTHERRTPAGAMQARGTVTLLAADPATLHYRIETRTDPAASAPAVAALLATLTPASSAADRARIEAAVAELKDMAYVEQTELTIDRVTGLIRRAHTDRYAVAPDGAHRGSEWDDLEREP